MNSEYTRKTYESLESFELGTDNTFGVLSISNQKDYQYKQFTYDGNELDTFSGTIPVLTKKRNSRERTTAFIVLICCIAFLGYFIYSWISCYMKKPKIQDKEEHNVNEDEGVGYNMESIADTN